MNRLYKQITGFLLGLIPLFGCAIFGAAIYQVLPNYWGLLIVVALSILAIWLGVIIFKRVQIIGPMGLFTLNTASPDMDNLQPAPDSETRVWQAEELAQQIRTGNNLFKQGRVRIYGKWLNNAFGKQQILLDADYNIKADILILKFEDKKALEVYGPKSIFEASTFLKINKAENVKWSWYQDSNGYKSHITYRLDGHKIQVNSDIDDYSTSFTFPGERFPALMLFG